jgi:amino acid permease
MLLTFQLAVLVGIAITYVVVGGDSLAAFAGYITPPGGAHLGKWVYYVMFGGLQLFLSMVRNHGGCRVCRHGVLHMCMWFSLSCSRVSCSSEPLSCAQPRMR